MPQLYLQILLASSIIDSAHLRLSNIRSKNNNENAQRRSFSQNMFHSGTGKACWKEVQRKKGVKVPIFT
jgi:hypothetical protein